MLVMRFFFAALILGALSQGARAEIFHMKDGGLFEGTITGVKPDDLDVSIAGKTLVIRKDSIGWIDYEPVWDGKTSRAGEFLFKVGVGGALPLPAYAFNNIASPGFASNLELLFNFKPKWAFGLRTDAFQFTTAYPQSETARAKAVVQGGAMYVVGRWLPLSEQRLSPFVVAGVGFNTYSEELEVTPKPGFKWLDTGTVEMREFENTATGSALLSGVGLQYLLGRHFVTDVEASWHYWTIDPNKFGSFLQLSSYVQTASLTARLGGRF